LADGRCRRPTLSVVMPLGQTSAGNRRVRTSRMAAVSSTVAARCPGRTMKAAVLGLARQAVLEDDHRGDDIGPLDVADVEALDPQRRLDRGRDIPATPPAPDARAVRSPARATLCRAKDCSALRRTVSIKARLSPRCGHPDLDLRAASGGEPGGSPPRARSAAPGRGPRGGPSPGAGRRRPAAGGARRRRDVGGILLGNPAALAPDAPAAHVEDLDGHLQFVVGDGEDVGVGSVAQHNGELLQALVRASMSSRRRAARLEVQVGGRRAHLQLSP
jgi:hypothetical protein